MVWGVVIGGNWRVCGHRWAQEGVWYGVWSSVGTGGGVVWVWSSVSTGGCVVWGVVICGHRRVWGVVICGHRRVWGVVICGH